MQRLTWLSRAAWGQTGLNRPVGRRELTLMAASESGGLLKFTEALGVDKLVLFFFHISIILGGQNTWLIFDHGSKQNKTVFCFHHRLAALILKSGRHCHNSPLCILLYFQIRCLLS